MCKEGPTASYEAHSPHRLEHDMPYLPLMAPGTLAVYKPIQWEVQHTDLNDRGRDMSSLLGRYVRTSLLLSVGSMVHDIVFVSRLDKTGSGIVLAVIGSARALLVHELQGRTYRLSRCYGVANSGPITFTVHCLGWGGSATCG